MPSRIQKRTRVTRPIGTSSNSEVVEARSSATYGEFASLDARLENFEILVATASHAALTLDTDAETIMTVNASQVLSLDNQTANTVFAGPASGAAADPTFRALVDADIPSNIVRNTVQVIAGAGMTGGGALSSNVTLDVVAADTSITVNANSIQVNLASPSGLVISAGLAIDDSIAGNGLTISSKILAVGAGDGIDVAANSVAVDVTDLIGTGLTEEATNNIAVDFTVVAAQSDLHPAVSIAPSISSIYSIGAGQTLSMDNQTANTIFAGPSSGAATTPAFRALVDADIPSNIVRNTIQVIAGTGLTGGGALSSNVTLNVGAGSGITVNANDVALTTPGTLTVSTSNSSTGSHTHAITTSNSVSSASAVILATNTSGRVRVQGIGVGAAVSANSWVIVGSGGGIGLSNTGAGRIAFTNTTVDTIIVSDAYVGLNGTTPEGFLHIDSTSSDPPCIIANAGTNGELATETGAQIRIGHWSGTTFTERWRMSTAGEWQANDTTVGHGITDFADTTIFGSLEIVEAASGGLNVIGYKDADGVNNRALTLTGRLGEAANTTKSAAGRGVVEIAAQIKSGTGVAAVGTNGNLLSVNTGGNTRWIVDTEGDTHRDGTSSTYDSHIDAHLARAFDLAVSPDSIIDSKFDRFVTYGKSELIKLGILHESGFYNESRLLRLAIGSVWQAYVERQELKNQIKILERKLLNAGNA